MMIRFLPAVVLTGVLAAETPAARMDAAIEAQQRGDIETAVAVYRDLLAVNPKLTKARHLLGLAELQRGNTNAGIVELERVRGEDPRNRQAVYTLLSTYVAVSRLDEAAALVKFALRGDVSAEARFMRGSYLMATAAYAEAITELRSAMRLNPKLPGLRSMLGVNLCFANRFNEAIPELEGALRENPNDGNAAAFLGWVYKERDRGAEALPLLSRTVAGRPDDVGALFLLAQLTHARGDAAGATAMLENVVGASPGHRGAHVLLARLYQQQGRAADAAKAREIVERLNAEQQAAQPGGRR
jgi:tetratricopeptide (TPR) repeat protein